MPELAEVEFYRKQWDAGLGQVVERIAMHPLARVFRGCDADFLQEALPGARLMSSEAHGKKLLFRLKRGRKKADLLWLGLHMGMTGKLLAAPPDYRPAKHDHLALFQKKQALVFSDFRQFGQVQVSRGEEIPAWWRDLPPAILSKDFSAAHVAQWLERRRRAPVKGVLLMQEAFPGIGNWMADEILWRAGIHPARPAGELSAAESRAIWREIREVTRGALRTVGEDFRDPPKGWLFHERWRREGKDPRTGVPLERTTVAGRTSCWSPARQRLRS